MAGHEVVFHLKESDVLSPTAHHAVVYHGTELQTDKVEVA